MVSANGFDLHVSVGGGGGFGLVIDKSTTAEMGMLNCGWGTEGNAFDIGGRVRYGRILFLNWHALAHVMANTVPSVSKLILICSKTRLIVRSPS